jgi:hypothetical protein
MARRRRRKRQNKLLRRFVRSIMAIVILTAFVLFVSFAVKTLATMDAQKFVRLSSPLLARLHINVDEEQVGEVAGKFVERITKTSISTKSDGEEGDSESAENSEEDKEVLYKVALMADSEGSFHNLNAALVEVSGEGITKVFFLGDLTGYGEKENMVEGKGVLDASGLEYIIIPGDHDLAASEPPGTKNFEDVFDLRHKTAWVGDYKFVMFDNSANYTPLSEEDMLWFQREVDDADFVLLSQPLYHPSVNRVMGVVDGEEVEEVKSQADELLNMIRGFDVKAVFAGDQHSYSKNRDEVKPELTHYVVGALLKGGLRNPEGPHYSIMVFYDDGSYKVENISL